MNTRIVAVISWIIVLWSSFVFLSSLPYKFTGAPETQHIFGTIGAWLGGFLGSGIGGLFSNLGGYIIGSFELLTSIVLLLPGVLWLLSKVGVNRPYNRARLHSLGGLMAAALMAGAAFFHIFSPLGINVQGDGGLLFKMAISVLLGGIILFVLNRGALKSANAS